MKRIGFALIILGLLGYVLVPCVVLFDAHRQDNYRSQVSRFMPAPSASAADNSRENYFPFPCPTAPAKTVQVDGAVKLTCSTTVADRSACAVVPNRTVDADGTEKLTCSTSYVNPPSMFGGSPKMVGKILREESDDWKAARAFEECDVAVSTLLLFVGVSPFVIGRLRRGNGK